MNATFYAFKRSGKFYAAARGVLPEFAFNGSYQYLEAVLAANNNKFPGLAVKGDEFFRIVVPDESVSFGFPIFIHPTGS